MGRYTTVQAFKDTDTRVPALSYEVATGKVADPSTGELVEKEPVKKEDQYDEHGRKKRITEKVVNPYGSTAGAGSGEFHTYRHARDRENRRIERMMKAKKATDEQIAFAQKLARNKMEADLRTAKKRAKRKRKKQAKKLAKIRQDLNREAGIVEEKGQAVQRPSATADKSKKDSTTTEGNHEILLVQAPLLHWRSFC